MVHIDGKWFKDEQGRVVMLRGVNLGGSSKVPARPDGATHIREGFFDHRQVSFVGRPFPLDEADEHFRRLRSWGYNSLRFVVTWEAIEHMGPGAYDDEYLEYVRAVVKRAGEHGFLVIIDPHQDVWSRFSGGDGAPGWTFEAAGMDLTRFQETGAAIVHALSGGDYPRMIWFTNGYRLASATLFTLFFGGETYAPEVRIEGVSVQQYLQSHYIEALMQVAERLKDFDCVLGYGGMNEPSPGWIGWPDLGAHHGMGRMGPSPTPYQSMLLGSGIPQEVEVWAIRWYGLRVTGRKVLNPTGATAWLPGRGCIWRRHGVWDVSQAGTPTLLQRDYFARLEGRAVDFNEDFLKPFLARFIQAMRSVDTDAILFVEGDPTGVPPTWRPGDPAGIVNATHWYDDWTLVSKRFIPWFTVDTSRGGKMILGRRNVGENFKKRVEAIHAHSVTRMGGVPTVIGECGIPFDLDEKRAYRSGNFYRQVQALDASLGAIEENLLNVMVWNYTADNTNAHGDQWNEEDFSIFSRDQQKDPQDIHSGGRALEAAVRPYPLRVAGEPLRLRFDPFSGRFEFEFRSDPRGHAPTDIFVPRLQYPRGIRVWVSSGRYEMDEGVQVVRFWPNLGGGVQRIQIERSG